MEQLLNTDERNCDSYSELIHLCGKAQNLETAMRVFTLMENRGIKPTSSVLNAVISACLHSGNVITALSIFETMENSNEYKPNSDTYNGFISAFASSGNGKSMLAWYDAKLASGFPGDIQTYEALISGCIKSKSFEDANRFFEEMVSAKIIPNASILHNMLVGFCEQRDLVKVRGFVNLLLENGWEINGEMAEKLVNFYSELRMMDEMEKLLATLMKEGGGAEVLSPVHYAIIRKYAKLDRLDDVEYSVGRMLKQGISFRCPDDIEKVLSSYFRRAAYDRLDLFLECIKASYKFSRSTYDLLIAGYRRAGLQEKMDKVIQDMQMAGLA